jgi:hypothetical protein
MQTKSSLPHAGLPPHTTEALRDIQFLVEVLEQPFTTTRFSKPDINLVHQRDADILCTCKSWASCVSMAEIVGMKSLIGPIYEFFRSGRALTWIEVMATARHLHAISETVKELCIWADRAVTVGQSPESREQLEYIKLWTKDVEYLVADYGPCLKTYPGEIYFLSPNFFPVNSVLREHLQKHSPSRSVIERSSRELFKFLRLPSTVASDSAFCSTDLTRFTFSPGGSLLAFRGSHTVIVFSVLSGSILCTFRFPRVEPTFLAFSPGATMLAVSFSTGTRLLQVRTGKVVQEVHERGVKRHNSVSLGKGGKKLHTRHKSLEVGSDVGTMNFSAAYLEEKVSAVGYEGVHALLTGDGIFKVSDEGGNILCFRRLRMEEGTKKGGSLRKGLTALKRSLTSGSQRGMQQLRRLQSIANSRQRERSSPPVSPRTKAEIYYKCYDIGTHEAEDVAVEKILQEFKPVETPVPNRYPYARIY